MDVLREFRDEPMPPSGVDVARAVRAGRRRRRTRIGVVALGLVAVVAAGAATAPRWQAYLPGRSGSSQVGDSPVGSPPLTCDPQAPLPPHGPTAVEAGQAPAEFDVLRYWVDVSAVPGYRIESVATARFWQRLWLTTSSGDIRVEVILNAKDIPAVFPSAPSAAPEPVDPTTGTPSTPVGQSPAYWLPGRQATVQFEAARLGWQWAPGAWAFVAAADISTEDALTAAKLDELRSVARQVAETIHIGPGAPVRSPFTMPVPDCTRLVLTELSDQTTGDGRPFTRFTLHFGTDDYQSITPLLVRPDDRTVTVTGDSIASPDDKPGSVTQTIEGLPARVAGDVLVLFGVDGFSLELDTPGGEVAAQALYHRIHVLPGAHDSRSAWTDAPLVP